jgi:hypothetical protein
MVFDPLKPVTKSTLASSISFEVPCTASAGWSCRHDRTTEARRAAEFSSEVGAALGLRRPARSPESADMKPSLT